MDKIESKIEKMGTTAVSLLSDSKYFDESSSRFAELRKLLDSRDEKEKLEAMKRLIAMMTLGRDSVVVKFFPDVVKNVIVASTEVKKLVYMFIINYAETNQELALLSINTFQKDLTNQNARVRASAMKAMSSIRISVVIPLVILALKSAVKDTSPYVKRAAATSIPKVFSVDPDMKDQLMELIAELLKSPDPSVLGAAMFAFSEVCPDSFELLHEHYRKLCHLIADFDEWGQVVTLNVLCRYGRTQFLSPFKTDGEGELKVKDRPFYSDDENSDDEDKSRSDKEDDEDEEEEEYEMDPDHSLLLKQAALLLHSRNASVVLSVASLFWALAPPHELNKVARPLVHLMRNRRSIQFALLVNIATMAAKRPLLFRPYIKDFFVVSNDPVFLKEIKLDVLASLTSEGSVSMVLTELQAYCQDPDKRFVSKAIQCMGLIAHSVPSVSDTCLHALSKLLTSPSQSVAAQAVVVIRQLLQNDHKPHTQVIKNMAKLLPSLRVPSARSAIIWMMGEYRERVPTVAPDVLRMCAKSFKEEDDTVKQQILNFAVKLYLSNPKQTALLFKYIMDLAKFDVNYDLRDRARMMRAIFFKKKAGDGEAAPAGSEVKEQMKKLLLAPKPSPHLQTTFSDRERYILGSLSHALNQLAAGYEALPDFPLVAPDPKSRQPQTPVEDSGRSDRRSKRSGSFYSDDESDRSDEEEDDDDKHFSEYSDSGSGSGSGSDDDDEDGGSTRRRHRKRHDSASEDESDSGSGSGSGSDEDEESGSEEESGSGSDDDEESGSEDESESERSESESDSESERRRAKKQPAKKAPQRRAVVEELESDNDSDSEDERRSSKAKASSKNQSKSKPEAANPLAGLDFASLTFEEVSGSFEPAKPVPSIDSSVLDMAKSLGL